MAKFSQRSLISTVRIRNPFFRAGALGTNQYLWAQQLPTVNALEVFRQANEKKISLAPELIFSPQRKFENCIRLNYGLPWSARVDAGLPWSARVDAAISTLGNIVGSRA